MSHVLVMAKAPQPGRVKTRLCPPCSPGQAAAVAEAALATTLAAVVTSGASRRIVALDGPPGPWLPPGFDVLEQRGDGLAERLANAWAAAAEAGVQIGMDTPQVSATDLDAALETLAAPGTDAVLGPARDGGWWLIGLRNPRAVAGEAFAGVPMSAPTTGAAQLARLAQLGLRVGLVDRRRDVDRWADATAVAATIPGTPFAEVVRDVAATLMRRRPGSRTRAGRGGRVTLSRATRGCRPGRRAALEPRRWLGPATTADRAVLAGVEGPVLDVGCGPARHVRALLDRGVPALGIDVSPAAVRLARQRGAAVLRRSIYDRVPGTGRWRTVLLLDGSIGIGGDPAALLRRTDSLVAGGGTVLVEVAPPGVPSGPLTARLDRDGPSFRWARVGVDALAALAEASGLTLARTASLGGRWFGWLTR